MQAEKTTVFISVANPFHLYDVPMVPVGINTYNGSREAIRQAVEKITENRNSKETARWNALRYVGYKALISCGRSV